MKVLISVLALSLFTSTISVADSADPFRCNQSKSCSFACPQNCKMPRTELYRGTFAPSGPHQTEGTVRIEASSGMVTYLVLDSDFRTVAGPDLRIVLRDSSGLSAMRVLAPLLQVEGEQNYPLSLSAAELSGFDEVVIYCAKFHVDFGIAKIR